MATGSPGAEEGRAPAPENGHRTRRESFRWKIFLLLVTGSVGTVLLIAAFWLYYAWSAVEQTAHRDLRMIAQRTAGEIDQYLSGKTDTLVAARELLSYPGEQRYRLEIMLKRIALELDQFHHLTLFDLEGRPIAATDDGAVSPLPPEILAAVGTGEKYRSPMRLSEGDLPYIQLALPLYWQGEIFRVLYAEINILDVWNRIDSIRIGETGRAAILSPEGTFLAHPDKEKVLKRYRGEDVLGTHIPIGEESAFVAWQAEGGSVDVATAPIPATGWTVLIFQSHWETLTFLRNMLYHLLVIVCLCLLGAYYAATRLSLRLSRPIEELQRGVDEMAKGNLTYQVPPLSGVEMAALGEHLNGMARTLMEKAKTDKRVADLERLAAVGRLSADVAHEINNPLGIIRNYLYLTKQEGMAEDDPKWPTLQVIGQEIERISRIIDSFKEFSRGNQTIELQEVDPLLPLQDALALCGPEFRERRIDLKEALGTGGRTMAHYDKLEQVYLNLIKNAMEAMPQGGELVVGSAAQGDKLVITIADTGTGIMAEHLPRLFDPFFSTKGVKGTGLGLSVSYGIINAMKGEIEVESTVGKGTAFRIILPAVQTG